MDSIGQSTEKLFITQAKSLPESQPCYVIKKVEML